MKPTLYEALGLSPTATESEIKDALRRLVRRYYAKTRAGHTDVEEALRFLNHASHILGNGPRRADYDRELAENIRTESTLTTVAGQLGDDAASSATVESKGGPVKLVEYPDYGHIGLVLKLAAPLRGDGAILAAVAEFVRNN